MSWLDLDPKQEENARQQRALFPADTSDGASLFSGASTAPFSGFAKGAVVTPALAVNLALSAIPRGIDVLRGDTEASDWWFDRTVKPQVRYSHELTPDPRTSGIAANLMHSFAEVLPQAMLLGPANTGLLKGVSRSAELVSEGVDVGTAMKVGTVEGVALGVGVGLPMSIGLKTLGNALYGAGTNVAIGMAQRGGTHQVLAQAGYTEMAAQYKMLDAQQIAIDAVLGVAFGGAGTILEARAARQVRDALSPDDLNAALAANNANHLELAGPGMPADFAARQAHVEAIGKAMDDLMDGRPVDVSQTRVDEAAFVPDPARAETQRELAPLMKPYEEIAEQVRQRDLELDATPGGMDSSRSVQVQAALKAQGVEVTPDNVAKTALIVQARAIDAKAVDALPGNLADAEYFDRVRGIVDAHEQVQAATLGLEQPQQAAGMRADVPVLDEARRVAGARPDAMVMMDDGSAIPVHEALARSDEIISQAKREASAIDAAVECMLAG